jgi:hypothetical protein
VNEEIQKNFGFGKEVALVKHNKCPFCKRPVKESDFKDSTSRREWKLSGLCQHCQDETFGVE